MNGSVGWSLSQSLMLAVRGRYNRDTGRLDALGFPVVPSDIENFETFLLDQSLNGYQLNIRVEKALRWWGYRPFWLALMDSPSRRATSDMSREWSSPTSTTTGSGISERSESPMSQ